jgi:hypothetical protein
MRILLWHVHGSWTTAFVQGGHDYVLPVTPGRGSDGLGRAATWQWPANVREVSPERLAAEPVDVVVCQRPRELSLAERWLGRRPGRDVPAVYVEHDAPHSPHPDVLLARHPLADRDDITLVHVTHFNALMWDSGRAPVRVIEHGIVDPGQRYTGELARAGLAVNEPLRRGRTVGTDLLCGFAARVGLDVFGMDVSGLPAALGVAGGRVAAYEDLPQAEMHTELARRRLYLHPVRWTSLGLSLIEAMALGMPVVALATTEAVRAVPTEAGVLSTSVAELHDACAWLMREPERARLFGKVARDTALARYGLGRFLGDWDDLMGEVTR